VEGHLGALSGALKLPHVLGEIAANAFEGAFVSVSARFRVVKGQEDRVERLGHAHEVLDEAPESAALGHTKQENYYIDRR